MLFIDPKVIFDGRLLAISDAAQLLFLRGAALAALLKKHPLQLTHSQFVFLRHGLTWIDEDGDPHDASETEAELMLRQLENSGLIDAKQGDDGDPAFVFDPALACYVDGDGQHCETGNGEKKNSIVEERRAVQ